MKRNCNNKHTSTHSYMYIHFCVCNWIKRKPTSWLLQVYACTGISYVALEYLRRWNGVGMSKGWGWRGGGSWFTILENVEIFLKSFRERHN